MRLFVALVPPEDLLDAVDEHLAPRRDAADGPRWTDLEQVHLTLAFLPSAPAAALPDLEDALAEVAARTSALDLTVEGAGAFPDPFTAKVLWLGVSGEVDRLAGLARAARSAASVVGAAPDGGTFRGHLTVARWRRTVNAVRWVRSLETYAALPWRADRVSLVESHLGQGRDRRPRYQVLGEWPLTGA